MKTKKRLLAMFLAATPLFSSLAMAEIVPDSRRVVWTNNVGVPGGIPNRTTICTTVPAGASLSTVQSAVDGCPAGQVVKLSAGTYTWPSGASLNMKSQVTLRGAGPSSTIINSSAGNPQRGDTGGITFASDVYTGVRGTINLTSGYTKGSSTLVASTTDSNLRVGYTILVNQEMDGSIVYNGPDMPGGYLRTDITPEGDGRRPMNQRVVVTAINGNNISISPPLYYTFSSSLNPHIYYDRSSSTTRNSIEWAGVEDLQVVNSNSEGTAIGMNRAAYSWVKNVKTVNAAVYHIGVYRCFRCEIRHNTSDSSLNYTQSHGYVIALEYQSSACLIEDNIVVNQRQFIEANSGSSGNVIIYNYMANPKPIPGYGFMVHSGGSHSAHPMMNLFEGNIGYKWNADYYWGSSSHQTLLRNWFGRYSDYADQVGAAIVIDEKNSFHNVVGNVLGYSGINSNPNWTTRYPYRVSPASMAYDRAWASIRFGYWSDSDTGGGFNAASQWADTIVAGNYDYVSATSPWYNPTTPESIPASYYYTSKPAYFGNLAWPPIDPAGPTVGETVIPAGYRYANGTDPVSGPIPMPPTNLQAN